MSYIIGIIGLIATVFFVVKLIMVIIKKQSKKQVLKALVFSLLLFFIGVALTPIEDVEEELKQEQNSNDVLQIDTKTNESIDNSYIIKHGELLNTIIPEENKIVFKVKISPSYSDSATVNQNYFNVEDLILNQGLESFEVIDYWAVADMTSGEEEKVIAFTLDREDIELIAEGYPANQIGEIANDLWIHPSLQK